MGISHKAPQGGQLLIRGELAFGNGIKDCPQERLFQLLALTQASCLTWPTHLIFPPFSNGSNISFALPCLYISQVFWRKGRVTHVLSGL